MDTRTGLGWPGKVGHNGTATVNVVNIGGVPASAKAVVVNLEIDPDFTARSVFDTLRAEPITARLPIIICARNAWLQPKHRHYIEDKRLRLLLVPFTPG